MVHFQRERHEENGTKNPEIASLPTARDNLLENKLSFANEAGNLAGGGKLENEHPEHGYKKSGVSSLDMLLKPGTKDQSKCEVLRVTNFINKLVQKEEDKILAVSQGTKLYIKGGPKKPSLEALTVPQWVIGSIWIFYHLLEGNKFQDGDDMLSYMGHMVKVMELAKRHEWLGVVKFDDEFRHIQLFMITHGFMNPITFMPHCCVQKFQPHFLLQQSRRVRNGHLVRAVAPKSLLPCTL